MLYNKDLWLFLNEIYVYLYIQYILLKLHIYIRNQWQSYWQSVILSVGSIFSPGASVSMVRSLKITKSNSIYSFLIKCQGNCIWFLSLEFNGIYLPSSLQHCREILPRAQWTIFNWNTRHIICLSCCDHHIAHYCSSGLLL